MMTDELCGYLESGEYPSRCELLKGHEGKHSRWLSGAKAWAFWETAPHDRIADLEAQLAAARADARAAKAFLEKWLFAYTMEPIPRAWLSHNTREFLALANHESLKTEAGHSKEAGDDK